MQLNEAKKHLTIPVLWALFGYPRKPGKSCRSPWRSDRHASFSVFANGTRWKDHGTGETGDAVDFLAMATGLHCADACREFIRLAEGSLPVRVLSPVRTPVCRVIPKLDAGTETQMQILSTQRHISSSALDIAVSRGLLLFGRYRGYSSWFITDSSRRAIQARRLDGKLWWNTGPKAINLPGTAASWPVGAANVAAHSHVIVVEGGPDLLAGFHFLHAAGIHNHATVIAVLGASNTIQSGALTSFSGKRVRILPHSDRAGIVAGERWKKQFQAGGALVDIVHIETLAPEARTAKDLNDLCQFPCQSRIASALAKGFLPCPALRTRSREQIALAVHESTVSINAGCPCDLDDPSHRPGTP